MRRSFTFNDVLTDISQMVKQMPKASSYNMEIVQQLLHRLDLLPILQQQRHIHIAGTKGKGTTAMYTAKLLQHCPTPVVPMSSHPYQVVEPSLLSSSSSLTTYRKVGLFTSPHLLDPRERMTINGGFIPEDEFTHEYWTFKERYEACMNDRTHPTVGPWPDHLWECLHPGGTTTTSTKERSAGSSKHGFFRFSFLLALQLFHKAQVDFVVTEVGLGGRLDATNAIPRPVVCGITALGYDHMEILGHTIEAIASEKAGIMKPKVPVFSAPQRDFPQTIRVLETHAKEVGAPMWVVEGEERAPGSGVNEPVMKAMSWEERKVALNTLGARLDVRNDDRPGTVPKLRVQFDEARCPILVHRGSHMVENALLAVALADYALLAEPQPRSLDGQPAMKQKVGIRQNGFYIDSAPGADGALGEFSVRWSKDLALAPLHARVIEATEHVGRSQTITRPDGQRWFLDGAHTVESIRAACRWWHAAHAHHAATGTDGSVSLQPMAPRRATLLLYTTRHYEQLFHEMMREEGYRRAIGRVVFVFGGHREEPNAEEKKSVLAMKAAWEKSWAAAASTVAPPELVTITERLTVEVLRGHGLLGGAAPTTVASNGPPADVFVTGSLYLVATTLSLLQVV